jgi:hypothetical protein
MALKLKSSELAIRICQREAVSEEMKVLDLINSWLNIDIKKSTLILLRSEVQDLYECIFPADPMVFNICDNDLSADTEIVLWW